jgi:hypothetical protein
MGKHLCDCGAMAQWHYDPSSSEKFNHYICDDCISSPEDEGCSCNWHYTDVNAYYPALDNPELPEGEEGKDWQWVQNHKEEGAWQYLDEKGRPYPCCEFWYEKDGFDIYVKLFLSETQKKLIEDCKQKYDYIECDIYLKNGVILEKEWIYDKSYLLINEDLKLSNEDILTIKCET